MKSKATRIRYCLLRGDAPHSIAKELHCSLAYVYLLRRKFIPSYRRPIAEGSFTPAGGRSVSINLTEKAFFLLQERALQKKIGLSTLIKQYIEIGSSHDTP